MIHSQYHWNIKQPDTVAAQQLSRELDIAPLTAALLSGRGYTTSTAAGTFLQGSSGISYDPFLLAGMQAAVDRIRLALERSEKIWVYGDYDADGVSSTSLMIQLLRVLKADFDIYIPHRAKEGYGLHNHALDLAQQQGVTLIVTVDTGISAVEQIAYATELGIDVVVTDHHEPPDELPQAIALVNPKLPYCPYPFKGLAGVGVAYKLAQALLDNVPDAWLEIVAIGTVADLMPLQDENRRMVSIGVEQMKQSAFPGVHALLNIAAIDPAQVTATHIAFAMAPRINASGRMEHASRAVELLTTTDMGLADRIAFELDQLNKQRQELVNRMVQEAVALLEAERDQHQRGVPDVIVIAGEGWNPGVVGIVASKLLDRYYRPTIVLGIDPATGMGKGSARSIPGYDIYRALVDCADVLDHFGGHPSAAGMSLHRDQLEAFRSRLNERAAQLLTAAELVPQTEADCECTLDQLTLEAVEELERLAPFGMNNPLPKIVLRGATLTEARTIGKSSDHLRLVVEQDGTVLEGVAFGKGELAALLSPGDRIDILAETSINEWRGVRKPQLMVQDIAVPGLQVWDRRGAADWTHDLTTIQTKWSRYMATAIGQIGVLGDAKRIETLKSQLSDVSLWGYDRQVDIAACNHVSIQYGAEAIRTLCLLSLPAHIEQLNGIFARFTALENIVLLHDLPNRQERLQIPDRERFKLIYGWLAKSSAEIAEEQKLIPYLSQKTSSSVRMVQMMLDVFEELGFIVRHNGRIQMNNTPDKRPLDSSRLYRELGELAEMEYMLCESDLPQLTSWMIARMQGVS
ncbi:single-stranded-DNA-specific exonuclease RecJ [Paenibacillus campi]|uniref:single-stranded-DNA-specific exonuclease RecJ n=1 Tax=Paenibacillus campi TaxID=3106031 RepID=UPI002AFE3E85|nr:single-stranded-DNA-specific exonuclease RecJ [Paenibacillus sp. SGZ-1014]